MLKTAVLFVLALLAFAGNSVINRLALLQQSIDAGSFVAIRIISGAAAMFLIWWLVQRWQQPRITASLRRGSWWGASMLLLYAVAFSLAYRELETGFGALILFASVQMSMLLVSCYKGAKLSAKEWLGSAIALLGLSYLVWPTLTVRSSLLACLMMILAGSAWGLYSLHGRASTAPLTDTTFNFIRAVPLALVIWLLFLPSLMFTEAGIWLAILSGVVTSGVGYAIWYLVLPRVKVTSAAIGQLSVPLLAALGGVLFAGELLTSQVLVAALLILGGMALVSFKTKK